MLTHHASATLYVVTGGSTSMTIDEGVSAALDNFDAYFDQTVSESDALNDPSPGNEAFTQNGTSVTLSDPIRPYGVVPSSISGRTPQETTLEFDSNDILGSWGLSSDSGIFTSAGPQIAFTSLQRWTGPFTGSLLYGDFGLRETSDTTFTLTSNISFDNADWAYIDNPTISLTDNTLTFTGQLLIGGGLTALDPTSVTGTPFGTFSMTADIQAVPEPPVWALMSMAALLPFLLRKKAAAL